MIPEKAAVHLSGQEGVHENLVACGSPSLSLGLYASSAWL